MEDVRPRWWIWLFLGVQVAFPLFGLWLRATGVADFTRFSWHMFSTLP